MGRIVLLSDEVASQVAAGEVVERPASVVKELVENSIDAGASQIEVAIARGGASVIRVVDNGFGMDRDDALLSLERHATSKIRTGCDLARIHTLGFRGEALPSIASVSRFTLTTRLANALEGTEIIVNGGKIEEVRVAGEAPGTAIQVRSLFYNLPARRKFLRSENTETSHIQHQLLLQAIGHFEVGFVFRRDQNLIFHTPAAGSLNERIRDLRGPEFLEQLLEIQPAAYHGIRVSGLIGKPGIYRSTRSEQIVFVNGRAIENITVQHGIREGYHTALMKGQFAVLFLFLSIDPELVDVNVHPAKREVRFREPDQVREAVANVIQDTLRNNKSRQVFSGSEKQSRTNPVSQLQPDPDLIPPVEQFALRKDWLQSLQTATAQGSPTDAFPEQDEAVSTGNHQPGLPDAYKTLQNSIEHFRIVGVLGKLYVLMESHEGLVLVDQHAAHERILFERLRRQMETAGVPIQRLLIPLTVQLMPKDYDWIAANASVLEKMGFALEPFGNSTLKIDGIPQFFRTDDPTATVRLLVDELRSMTAQTSRLRMGEDAIAKTVCRHAIKANDEIRLPEIQKLLEDLLSCDLPYCCPHGRPTMIQISYGDLEKKFGRK